MSAKSIKTHVRFLPSPHQAIQRGVAFIEDPWTVSACLRHETVAALHRATPARTDGTKRTSAKRTHTTSPRQ